VIDSFQAIDAVGPNDAWLTGQHTTNCTPNSDYNYIEHCTTTGCGGQDQSLYPRGFAGVAPNDVWAFGGTVGQSLMYQLVGPAWTPVAVPNAGALQSAATIASDDIWVLGTTGILHWNGSAWSVVAGALLPTYPVAIAAAGPDDIWVVGSDVGGHSAITHYSNLP